MPWFHGLISRGEAEELLKPRYIGCFLVRVSENRFGYTLSYRVSNRCRHYMVEQDTQHRYALVGVPKVMKQGLRNDKTVALIWPSSCPTLSCFAWPLSCFD